MCLDYCLVNARLYYKRVLACALRRAIPGIQPNVLVLRGRGEWHPVEQGRRTVRPQLPRGTHSGKEQSEQPRNLVQVQ